MRSQRQAEATTMGGVGSGRRRTVNRGTIEDVPLLDMREIRRLGLVKPGECMVDTLRWSQRGLTVAEARVRVDLSGPEAGSITVTVLGCPTQAIAIEGVPCRLGGQRFYFLCPDRGRRCEVLCLVGSRFASRQAHRLGYATQGMDELGRARKRRRKLRERLDGKSLQPRPRGRHRYDLTEQLRWATMTERALLAQTLQRRTARRTKVWYPRVTRQERSAD